MEDVGLCGDFSLHILNELLKGLEYLHNNGIIHRDVCPDNIILIKKGDDFQVVLSGNTYITKDARKCKKYFTPGNVGYVAPEVYDAKDNADYDCSIDIFSAGVCLYFILTGESIFDGDSRIDIINQTKKHKFDESSLRHNITTKSNDDVETVKHLDIIITLLEHMICAKEKRYSAKKCLTLLKTVDFYPKIYTCENKLKIAHQMKNDYIRNFAENKKINDHKLKKKLKTLYPRKVF